MTSDLFVFYNLKLLFNVAMLNVCGHQKQTCCLLALCLISMNRYIIIFTEYSAQQQAATWSVLFKLNDKQGGTIVGPRDSAVSYTSGAYGFGNTIHSSG